MSKPAILIVPASWHVPEHWAKQRKAFEDAGYTTHCPLLPSHRLPARPWIGLYEDAAFISDEIDKIAADGTDLIVIGHSGSGSTISEGVNASHAKRSRTFRGLKGGVVELIFVSAFVTEPGSTCMVTFNDAFIPGINPISQDGMNSYLLPETFFEGVPDAEKEAAVKMLRPEPAICKLSPIRHAPWSFIPSAYVVTTEDHGRPTPLQRWNVNLARQFGPEMEVYEIPSGHAPFLSDPSLLVNTVGKILAKQGSKEDWTVKGEESRAEIKRLLGELFGM